VRVTVWDTGAGIDAESRSAIFDEFVQLKQETTDKTKGLGLGLAIAKRSAQLMGTEIRLESEPGRGSAFSISLVNARSRTSVRPAYATPAVSAATTVTMLVSRRVLVIEDDEAGRLAMVELLGQWGCIALGVDSLSAAVAAVTPTWIPDVIVSDFRLRAGETGPEAIAAIEELTARTYPVVVVSGELALSVDAQSLGHPDWVVLRKPASAAALRTAFHSAIEAYIKSNQKR
jgi:CheY-like chemotaxis protein